MVALKENLNSLVRLRAVAKGITVLKAQREIKELLGLDIWMKNMNNIGGMTK